jgi:hypothetical protein
MIDQQLAESYLRRSKEQLDCTKECLRTITALRERGQWDVEAVWNVSCHINLLSHDLMAYLLFYGIIDDKWTRRASVRAIATLLYEGCDDLQVMLGKEFRDACTHAGILAEMEDDYRATAKQISAFRAKNESVVKPIRMTSGAHRDHDVVTFLADFISVPYDEILEAGKQFEDLLHLLARFTDRIIERMNNVYRENGTIC